MSNQELINWCTIQFANRFTSCPVEFLNNRIDTMNLDVWARFSMQFGPPIATNLQLSTARYVGIVSIQIFVREDEGVGEALELAGKAAQIFPAGVRQRVVWQPAETALIGRAVSQTISTTETQWYQILVRIPFSQIR